MIPTSSAALPFSFYPLFDAQRDVFAHYFPSFPLSLDNRAPLADYLTDAGTIKINAHAQAVPAGISAFKVPLEAGVPVFALQRNGSDVFSCAGPAQIYDAAGMPSGLLDMTYLSGSVSLQGLTAYSW